MRKESKTKKKNYSKVFFIELNCTLTSVFPYNENWENRQIVIIAIIVIIIIARRIVKSAVKRRWRTARKRIVGHRLRASSLDCTNHSSNTALLINTLEQNCQKPCSNRLF